MTAADDDTSAAASADAVLAATVARLRDELDGLRTAMRSRAVIEQAKGMLMERHGCDADTAFDRLTRLSQRANVKLVDVAAALVEQPPGAQPATEPQASAPAPTVPAATGPATPADAARATQRGLARHWPRQGTDDDTFGVRVRAQGRRAKVRSALLAARSPAEALAAVTRTALADDPPSAAVLAALDTTGVVRLLAAHGIAASQATRWHAFPLDVDLPVCRPMRTGTALWLDAPASGELGLGLPEIRGAAAILPLFDARGCLGVLALTWPPHADASAADPTSSGRRQLEPVAAALAVVVRRLAPVAQAVAGAAGGRVAPGPAGAALALLDATLSPLLLCRPVVGDVGDAGDDGDADDDGDAGGRPADLVIVHATPATTDPAGRGAADLAGRRFLELYPDAVSDGVWAACLHVMATGVQVDLPDHDWRVAVRRRRFAARAHLRITRYRDGVMITWSADGAPRAGDDPGANGSP